MILLIQLYGKMQPPDAEPLSIEVLAQAVLDSGIKTKPILKTLRDDDEQALSKILILISKNKGKLIVGISIPQSTYYLANKLIRAIYNIQPECIVVLGHALPTHSPELFLEEFPKALIVRGWGEESFVSIVKQYKQGFLKLEQIPNLTYKLGRDIINNNIDWAKSITEPYRIDIKHFFSRVEASRGCHYDVCTFCTRQPRRTDNSPWNRRSITRIKKDIESLKKHGDLFFTFTDEDFIGNNLDSALEIAEALNEIGGMQFSISVRADNIFNPHGDPEENQKRRFLFKRLLEAGLYLVYIGIESLSNTQLRRYGKGLTVDQCLNSMSIIKEIGVNFEMGYILFDPLLTNDELSENVSNLENTGLWMNVGQLYNYLRPQKDSSYVNLLKKKLLLGEYDPNTMFYNFSYLDTRINVIANICDSWYRKFDFIYMLTRNIERNTESSGEYAHFIDEIRLLMFRLLRDLAHNVHSPTEHILFTIDLELNGHIRKLFHSLSSRKSLSATEQLLRDECSSFLSLQENFCTNL